MQSSLSFFEVFFRFAFFGLFWARNIFRLALSDRALCRVGEMNFTFRPAGSAPRRVAHRKKKRTEQRKEEGLLGSGNGNGNLLNAI